MNILNKIISNATGHSKKIVLPEGEDSRVIEAAINAQSQGIAEICLLGGSDKIMHVVNELGLSINNIEIIDPVTSSQLDSYADAMWEIRKHKGMTIEDAKKLILNPLNFALMMVQQGDMDGAVCGAVYSSADVVRSSLQLIGKHEDYGLVSSCFLMLMDKPFHSFKGGFIFADCALNIEPNAQQLAQIALASAKTASKLLETEPTVAMLSFSTNQSAQHTLVDKVVEATKYLKALVPEIKVMGDVQFDAALIPEIYQKKTNLIQDLPANVFIFPNIEAGNIAYKITERLAQAEAIGPILQGLKKPVNDLSRGCKAQDIFNVIAITVNQSL